MESSALPVTLRVTTNSSPAMPGPERPAQGEATGWPPCKTLRISPPFGQAMKCGRSDQQNNGNRSRKQADEMDQLR